MHEICVLKASFEISFFMATKKKVKGFLLTKSGEKMLFRGTY